jgi:putative sigma-54 modulation protein
VVKKQCKTFEEGADIAIASLERQIKKKKQKLRARA